MPFRKRSAGAVGSAFARYHGTPPKQLNEIYQTFHQHQSMLDMLLEQKPAVVSFHFGVPSSRLFAASSNRER